MSRCFINIYRNLAASRYLSTIITVFQTVNLVFNLTPDTVPSFISIRYDYIQALCVATIFITLCGCTKFVRGRGSWNFEEGAALFSPLIVSLGAWMQKKGEVDTEAGLGELERARYKMKGA